MSDRTDASGMRMQLNELRSQLDHAIRASEDFQEIKRIYLEIKELECHLNVFEWQKTPGKSSRPYSDENRAPLL